MSAGASLELRDIHLPIEPGWWPPAPGWWLLAGIVCVLGWLAWRSLRRILQRRAGQRLLRRELADLQERFPNDTRATERLAACSELLRRACRRFAPDAVTLTGEEWLRFLDAGEASRPYSEGPGQLLRDGPFMPSVEPQDLLALEALLPRTLQQLAERADA